MLFLGAGYARDEAGEESSTVCFTLWQGQKKVGMED